MSVSTDLKKMGTIAPSTQSRKPKWWNKERTGMCSPLPVVSRYPPWVPSSYFPKETWYPFLSSSGNCEDRRALKEMEIRAQAKLTSAECRSPSKPCEKAGVSAVNQFSSFTHQNKCLMLCKAVFSVTIFCLFIYCSCLLIDAQGPVGCFG